jgi:benzoyl-CoA reductase/2-hydroxyglutaryl-CoA dehydratase subunit BcrC/BadD/HgdB
MTIPLDPNTLSDNDTTHVANQLGGLKVTDEPENIVKPKQSIIAVACQEFQEGMKVECESFSRNICSQLADLRQSLGAAIKGEGSISSSFASLRETMDRDHAELMEQLNVLKEKLDRMG